jgi:hypothetical protein
MKQYDLTGLQGEVSSFGAYFVFFFFAIIAIIAFISKIYSLAIGIVILAFIFYYFLFVKKKDLEEFSSMSKIYMSSQKKSL